MRKLTPGILLIVLFSWVIISDLYAGSEKEIEKTFEFKKVVKIKLVLGECILKKSSDQNINVHLIHSYDEDYFEPIFREKKKSLILQEKFRGRHNGGSSSWIISLPEKIEVDFESATGDLNIENIMVEIDGNTGTGDMELSDSEGQFDLNTGTGSILVENCQGEFDLNSGTGKVEIEDSKGDFDANSGTGDVSAYNIYIEDEADFNSGTGDAEVSRPGGENFDLSVNSGTNDAVLIMDSRPLEGYFELSAHSRAGDIRCPVDFDEEVDYMDGDGEYTRKSFTRVKKTPRYFISTGTGTAKLKK